MKFTEKEQKVITKSLMAINEILLLKMDEGVIEPTLQGSVDIESENRKVMFSFIAQNKKLN